MWSKIELNPLMSQIVPLPIFKIIFVQYLTWYFKVRSKFTAWLFPNIGPRLSWTLAYHFTPSHFISHKSFLPSIFIFVLVLSLSSSLCLSFMVRITEISTDHDHKQGWPELWNLLCGIMVQQIKHIIIIIINHHCHHNLWDLLWIINLEWAILQPITPPVKPSLIHVKPFQCEGNLMIIIFSLLFVKERGKFDRWHTWVHQPLSDHGYHHHLSDCNNIVGHK